MNPLEEVWEHREEVIYPALFGQAHRGIFTLEGDVFTGIFRQESWDPRWLTHGVHEYGPTSTRNSWVYVSSGTSNSWELDPEDYEASEISGIGSELVVETTSQADWAILILQRLLAYNILLAHGRFGEARVLGYGHRVPLQAPISLQSPSVLRNVVFTQPTTYQSSFRLRSGRADLLHAVAISDAELAYAKSNSSAALIGLLAENGVGLVTDPRRRSVL